MRASYEKFQASVNTPSPYNCSIEKSISPDQCFDIYPPKSIPVFISAALKGCL